MGQSPSSFDTEDTTRKSPEQAVEQATPMDVDRTDRQIEIVQSQEQSSDSQNTQLASRSTTNFVDCQGPVQVGSTNTSTVHNGPTYNYYFSHTHHHHHNQPPHQTEEFSEYIRRTEQIAASSVSVNCKECLPYHHSNHPPLEGHTHNHSESSSRHIPQLPSIEQHRKSHRGRIPQRLRSEQQREKTESSERAETVITTTHTDTANSSETRTVSLEPASGGTCVLDSRGGTLEPGDGVWFDSSGDGKCAVYVGNQEVVWCDEETRRVERKRFDLKQPFKKLMAHSSEDVRVFSAQVRTDRALSRVGTEYREGAWESDRDFVYWCYTGLTSCSQAYNRCFALYCS